MNVDIPLNGIGVTREAGQQKPQVRAEAQAALALPGVRTEQTRSPVRGVVGCGKPRHPPRNRRMVRPVLRLERPEAVSPDPTYTGEAMAGLIGPLRAGEVRPGQTVLFIDTCGTPGR